MYLSCYYDTFAFYLIRKNKLLKNELVFNEAKIV
jgi:hypothetical protein